MNENIDLTKILKDCPKGWKFWSPILGKVEFEQTFKLKGFVFVNVKKDNELWSFYSDATFPIGDIKSVEIMLYPSEDQRDWSKFTAPWYKKERDTIDWIKKQCEPNPYSGVSFKYNGHTCGMCGRDNGVEILVDGEIKERIFLDNKPKGKSALEAIKEEKVDNELTKTL